MSITVSKFNSTIRAHWFLLAAAVIVTGNIAVASLDSWSSPGLLEAGVLFDLAFFGPSALLVVLSLSWQICVSPLMTMGTASAQHQPSQKARRCLPWGVGAHHS